MRILAVTLARIAIKVEAAKHGWGHYRTIDTVATISKISFRMLTVELALFLLASILNTIIMRLIQYGQRGQSNKVWIVIDVG